MMHPYTGLEAQFHDLFWQSEAPPHEASHLLELLELAGVLPPSSVLEMGCGSGRILAPLDAAGYRLQGCDTSEEMLAGARQRFGPAEPPPLHLASIDSLSLAEHFAAVLLPGFTGMLLEHHSLGDGLANARCHLNPGGLLVATFFTPWAELEAPDAGDQWNLEKEIDLADGGSARYFSRYRIDPRHCIVHRRLRYEHCDSDGRQLHREEFPQTLHWWDVDPLLSTVAGAGFSECRCYGDFSLAPYDPEEHMLLTVTATRTDSA